MGVRCIVGDGRCAQRYLSPEGSRVTPLEGALVLDE